MKKIQLKSITLENFKGQNRTVAFNEKSTVITGANGVGKTSIMRAFVWLLTGRTDANGKINSELFDNRVELSPETPLAVVKATITIDGAEHTLSRSAKAKFKRPKGQTEFVKADSDEYSFAVDGMPYTATDYAGWVAAQIAPADLLPIMLLGETFAILAENKREQARKVLTDIIGEKTPNLGKYEAIRDDIQSGEPADKIAERYRQSAKEANEKLNAIPEKISVHSENVRQLKEADAADNEDYDGQIDEISDQINKIRERMNGKTKDAGEANKAAKELAEKKRELQKQSDETRHECEDLMVEQSKLESGIETLTAIVKNGKSACPTCGTMLDLSDEELAEKKKQLDYFKEQLNVIHKKVTEKDALAYKLEKEANEIVVPVFVKPDTTEEQDEAQRLNDLLAELKAKKAVAESRKSQIATAETCIAALKEQQKAAAKTLADTELKKMKLDEYSQKCAELLSGEVNSLMSGTKIQMFDVQKNGERKPSCTITNNEGVKYSTLNFSARILANIEISRLFCHLLDVSVPCFVDECSVFDSNHLPTIDGTQMIYMRCSDDQKLVVS